MNLPSSEPGTEPLSNLPGTAFTNFGAASYTLALFPGFTSVITPAPFDAGNAAATGTADGIQSVKQIESGTATRGTSRSASGTNAGAAGGTSTGSSTGTAATPSKTNGAIARYASRIMLSCIIAATVTCNLS